MPPAKKTAASPEAKTAASPVAKDSASKKTKKPKDTNKPVSCLRHTKAIANGMDAAFNIVFMLPILVVINEYQYGGWRFNLFFGIRPAFALDLLPGSTIITSTEAFALVSLAVLLVASVSFSRMVGSINALAGDGARGTISANDPPKALVVTGPYAYLRHPVMLSLFFILVCEGVILGSYWTLAYALSYWVYCAFFTTRWADTALKERFGPAFEEYCTNVPAWCPRLKAWDPGLLQV